MEVNDVNVHIIQSEPYMNGSLNSFIIDRYKELYDKNPQYYWKSDLVKGLIEDIPFVKACFEKGFYHIVDSYIACCLIFELGGLVTGYDVYPTKKLPKSYFNTEFVCRSTSTNGSFLDLTTHAYGAKGSEFFRRLANIYRTMNVNVAEDPMMIDIINREINKVLVSFGVDLRESPLKNQSVDGLIVYNASQFGCFDYELGDMLLDGNTIYAINTHRTELRNSRDNRQSLYYMVLDEETSFDEVAQCIDDFSRLDTSFMYWTSNLVVIVATTASWVKDAISLLKKKVPQTSTKEYTIMCIGDKIARADVYGMLSDIIGPVCHNVEISRNILIPRGRLTNPVGSPWALK